MANETIEDRERAPYHSSLRARHKEQTSILILETVATIIRRSDLSAVSIAEVARVADVTERTIYRHYATRDDMVRAFIKWHLDQSVGGAQIVVPNTIEDLLAWFGRRCNAWEQDHKIVTETYLSPLGRELRKPLYDLACANNATLIDTEIANLPTETRQHLAAAIVTLMSTENFVFQRQNLGYSPEQVYRSADIAIRCMLEGARHFAQTAISAAN